MKNPSLTLLPAFALAGFVALAAHAEEAANTIKFSDPARPGTVKVILGRGDLWVQGTDAADVVVKSEAKAVTKSPRKDGLRVLSASSSFSLTESDNVVTLDALSDMAKGGGEFRITVPKATSVVVQNSWGGEITCSNLDGDVEIKSMNGEIRLNEVGGGVLVETHNGEISASIRALRENKPLSFTSWNGGVVLRVPTAVKANVRLRTQNGSVLTDFEESALVTKTENTAGTPRTKRITTNVNTNLPISNNRVISQEVRDAIREAAQVGASAVKEALEAVREGLDAARMSADEARQQVDKARSEIDRARSRNRTPRPGEAPSASPAPAVAGVAPVPPKPPIPTLTGGKLVTGTLNGGGPEISVATMNGDVTLRRLIERP